MKTKTTSLLLLVASGLGFGAGLVLKSSTELGLCLVSEPTCINSMTQFGNILFYSTPALAIGFIALLIVPKSFSAWRKFAIWFVPLMFLYFAIYENEGFFSIPEESVYKFLSGAYVVVSLIIIAIASRGKK